jgi:hypothetical protein
VQDWQGTPAIATIVDPETNGAFLRRREQAQVNVVEMAKEQPPAMIGYPKIFSCINRDKLPLIQAIDAP